MDANSTAPGKPGVLPHWTSSAKSGIGKGFSESSKVTFTIGNGIMDEIYFPREDIACMKDMQFVVTDGNEFLSKEFDDTNHSIKWFDEGIPGYKITNTCKQGRYTLEKEIITDPCRDTVLQKIKFKAKKKGDKFKLFMVLHPHLNDKGHGNTGWVGDYKGIPMLFAYRQGITMAVCCFYSDFIKRSAGYVGTSDGYADLEQHKEMQWEYKHAPDGNITLTAEIHISKAADFVIAISFGTKAEDAGHHAWGSLLDGYETARQHYISEWKQFQKKLTSVKSDRNTIGKNFRASATVLNLHKSKSFPGGVVASLSIPWGQTKGDKDMAGYHLVWPRDLVESSGGFLALNSKDELIQILNYLMTTQEDDGKWSQNMWLDGIPHWTAVQMDEIALPIILVEKCHQNNQLDTDRLKRYWPGIKKAISFMILHGPATEQDRWEEEGGLTAFTLASEVTALLAGAHLAELDGRKEMARYCRETADYWNEQIEKWTYVTDTPLSKEVGVDGYYMRINPTLEDAETVKNNVIYLQNRNEENGKMHLYELVCVDALALVRFGLRKADDPKIVNTVKVIDAKLKVDTPNGPCWHRYPNDGYGEDKNGNPFPQNGYGIGRAWPLLAGERAHYEIAAGNIEGAKEILKSMDRFSNNGLIPEQIWDTDDIPEKGLYFGQHSGSAMPLVWAHSEYIKLCNSIKEKKIFDMSPHTTERYIKNNTKCEFVVWRFSWPCKQVPVRKNLRIEVEAAASVHWSTDKWHTTNNTDTKDTDLGIHYVDIDLKNAKGEEVYFTFYWKEANHWENKNYKVPLAKNEEK
ncbi:MAG TPA: glycoside hydrolase family 15 protein [Hanamia sp.]|nr:glycoside hydrolase family 15 protein [Hanamia sp.]